jgi:hypothetical protein
MPSSLTAIDDCIGVAGDFPPVKTRTGLAAASVLAAGALLVSLASSTALAQIRPADGPVVGLSGTQLPKPDPGSVPPTPRPSVSAFAASVSNGQVDRSGVAIKCS